MIAAGRMLNSLSQTLLKLTSPGVPDVYQGTELWDLSLVNSTDNRRPVEPSASEIPARGARWRGSRARALGAQIVARADEGLPKLAVTSRALRLRARRPECFDARGSYEPVEATGPRAGHVVAFQRGDVVVIAPRLVLGLAGPRVGSPLIPPGRWEGTRLPLPSASGTTKLTGLRHDGADARPLAALLAEFPVALLVREAAEA